MTITEKKKKWVEDRVQQLRDQGLTNAAIARRMGISPAWFSEAMDKPAIGDKFVAKLEKAFGFRFSTEAELGESRTITEGEAGAKSASPDLTAAVVRLEQQVSGLVSAQVMLLARLEEVLRDRKAKK